MVETVLTAINDAIAATLGAAHAIATVAWVQVAIIANFNALMNNIVTACRYSAAVETRIHLHTISIIAGFKALRFGVKVVA